MNTMQPSISLQDALLARHLSVRALKNRFLTWLCIALSLATLVPLFSIIFLVLQKGLPLISWNLFTQLPPAAGLKGGGIGNAMVGSALMVGLAMAMASPLGIMAAIFTNEYEPRARLTQVVRFAAKLLTGGIGRAHV